MEIDCSTAGLVCAPDSAVYASILLLKATLVHFCTGLN